MPVWARQAIAKLPEIPTGCFMGVRDSHNQVLAWLKFA
jgi:hypothetical protein